MKKALLLLALPVVLTGCFGGGSVSQDETCLTHSSDTNKECKVGHKIFFAPSSFGNEQYPLAFIANNCDMRYSVAVTTGGAVCIMQPNKKNEIK